MNLNDRTHLYRLNDDIMLLRDAPDYVKAKLILDDFCDALIRDIASAVEGGAPFYTLTLIRNMGGQPH